jgi:hypothetical protein
MDAIEGKLYSPYLKETTRFKSGSFILETKKNWEKQDATVERD